MYMRKCVCVHGIVQMWIFWMLIVWETSLCTETIDYKMDAIEIASDVVKYNLWMNGHEGFPRSIEIMSL